MKQVLFFLFFSIAVPVLSPAQSTEPVVYRKDSMPVQTTGIRLTGTDTALQKLLNDNAYLNSSGTPVAMAVKIKKNTSKDGLFYLITLVTGLLAIFRYLYSRYFSNLFRVFFNSSLRQSQLTDQLLQAKFPSLLFNFYFTVTGGIFLYLLLAYFHWISDQNSWIIIGSCTGVIALIYVMKYCILKFTGWVTGYKEVTNTYIFIFFLINKIIGILLVPFIILIAFADLYVVKGAVNLSLIIIGLLLLLRFFRSYGLLQHQLKVSRIHFILYIVGIELVPLLLIYKGLVLLLNKNM